MAISEKLAAYVCKIEVKEKIDRYMKTEGISRNEASKKLAAFYTGILGVEIKPETIRQEDKRARWREYKRQLRHKRFLKGQCSDCGEPALKGHTRCEKHYLAHRQYNKELKQKRRKEGKCISCGKPLEEFELPNVSCVNCSLHLYRPIWWGKKSLTSL